MDKALFALETAPDQLGDVLKVVQIGFYIIAAFIGILTYRAAVRGLLSPVNTEYQKRVMDRLAELSEDLYAEFDPGSEKHWSSISPVRAAIEEINDTFEKNKEEVLAEKKWYFGTPYTEDIKRLNDLLQPVISDPFIPDNIREAVVDLLENRLHVMHGIYGKEFEKYCDNLAKGKHGPAKDLDDVNKIHNRINDQKNKQGCGITQIENAVHDIRVMIQGYFDSFNPRGKRRPRKKFEKEAEPG